MDIRAGIVGIKSDPKSKKILGTGFFVPGGFILTCAHVIAEHYQPGEKEDFQLKGQIAEFQSKVIYFSPKSEYDLAILQPLDEVDYTPLPIASSQYSRGNSFSIFGYPNINYEGLNGAGTIMGWTKEKEKDFSVLQLKSDEITHGFSGAPIWDEKLKVVVGILQQGIKNEDVGKPSFALPIEHIEEIEELPPEIHIEIPVAPAGLPHGSYLPFPRNEKFVGREDDLEQLHTALQGGESVGVRPAMLSGMGGIGKTQLAVEYAYRYGAKYPGGVYWINAAQDLLLQGMAETAEKIGLRITDDVPESQRLTLFANTLAEHLNSHRDALVIFDNIEDPQTLRLPVASFIPSELNCHILFTTRRRDIDKTFYRSFEVTVLPEGAALQLLLRHPSRQPVLYSKHNDHVWARIICMTLGYLPLALELAGAYLGKYNEISLQDYRYRLLDEGAMETVDDTELRPEDMPTRHDTAITATLKLSWEAIQDDPDAQLALKAAGQLREAELISTHLLSLLTGLDINAKPGHPAPLGRALRKLFEFSLIEELTSENLRLHPLVFGFASQLSDGNFRIEIANRLSEKLCNVNSLAQIVTENGIDTLITDTQVGLWLYGSESTKLKKEISSLNLLINNEIHNLRGWNANVQPSFLLQQLYNRALVRHAQNWQVLLRAYLETKKFPWLREIRPFSRVSPTFLRSFHGHSGTVFCVAVIPNGTQAISGSYDGTLRLWDLEIGEFIRSFHGHTRTVSCVAVTPDGKRAVSASKYYDKTLRLWDLESGECIRSFEGHSAYINWVAVTPDGRSAIFAFNDKTLRLWDLESGECIHSFEGHSDIVHCVAVTPDGSHSISASKDRTLRLWDLESGECIRSFEDHSGTVYCVAVTPDGKRAISGSDPYDRTLRLWNLESGECIRSFEGHSDTVHCVAVTPDGKHAISASTDRTLRLWDLESGECIYSFEGYSESIYCVAVTPDGKHAISGSNDKTLRLWDLESDECIRSFEGHSGPVSCVVVTPDKKHAISGSNDKTFRLWDLESGECIRSFEKRVPSSYVAVTPDGKHAISASQPVAVKPDGKHAVRHPLSLWDLESGEHIRSFEGHSGPVRGVVVTPDGKHAISASNDKPLRLWDLESGECIRTFEGHSGFVYCVGVTPDGKHAISGSIGKTLRLWDLESGECIRSFEGHSRPVSCIAVMPDEKRAISGSEDKTLRLWDLESGECQRSFFGHSDLVRDVAVTPNGRYAISASKDRTLRFWDIHSGKCLLVFASEAPFHAVATSLNGNMIIAGDELGAVHFIELKNM